MDRLAELPVVNEGLDYKALEAAKEANERGEGTWRLALDHPSTGLTPKNHPDYKAEMAKLRREKGKGQSASSSKGSAAGLAPKEEPAMEDEEEWENWDSQARSSGSAKREPSVSSSASEQFGDWGTWRDPKRG